MAYGVCLLCKAKLTPCVHNERRSRQGLSCPEPVLWTAARLCASCCTCLNYAAGQTQTQPPVRAEALTPAASVAGTELGRALLWLPDCSCCEPSLGSSQYPQAKRLAPLQSTSGSLPRRLSTPMLSACCQASTRCCLMLSSKATRAMLYNVCSADEQGTICFNAKAQLLAWAQIIAHTSWSLEV